MGYISSYYGLQAEAISLDLYADPMKIARFVGYLTARDVGIGQIAKHIALARKVSEPPSIIASPTDSSPQPPGPATSWTS